MDSVILLHGLGRTRFSMAKLARAVNAAGFHVANVSYPSRRFPIEQLATIALDRGLAQCRDEGAIHFVTHSLGGILLRAYLAKHRIDRLGRVVMLGPPNRGSELVDRFHAIPGVRFLHGPAGAALGTRSGSVPQILGPVAFELGVIAGSNTSNPRLDGAVHEK